MGLKIKVRLLLQYYRNGLRESLHDAFEQTNADGPCLGPARRCRAFAFKEMTIQDSYTNVESFKFGDIARIWGRERLEHEVVIGRELAQGIIHEGLRFQSVNPKWVESSESFRGSPLVGFTAHQDYTPVLLRADALEHLLRVARNAVDPDISVLSDEYVLKDDFRIWLVHTGRALPRFWFDSSERHTKA